MQCRPERSRRTHCCAAILLLICQPFDGEVVRQQMYAIRADGLVPSDGFGGIGRKHRSSNPCRRQGATDYEAQIAVLELPARDVMFLASLTSLPQEGLGPTRVDAAKEVESFAVCLWRSE